jgi:hypothetical protein
MRGDYEANVSLPLEGATVQSQKKRIWIQTISRHFCSSDLAPTRKLTNSVLHRISIQFAALGGSLG